MRTLTEDEKDYSIIGTFTADTITGTCVYCNHCQPCPAGIDIGLVNKYYDLTLAGDDIAANHYTKLATKADACLQCGHCEERCPFSVKQMSRMVIHEHRKMDHCALQSHRRYKEGFGCTVFRYTTENVREVPL